MNLGDCEKAGRCSCSERVRPSRRRCAGWRGQALGLEKSMTERSMAGEQDEPTEEQKAQAFAAFGTFATVGEEYLWRDIDSGVAVMPDRPIAALMLLAVYTKRVAEVGEDGRLADEVLLEQEEIQPIMELLTVPPGWEPSPRWPFNRVVMRESLSELASPPCGGRLILALCSQTFKTERSVRCPSSAKQPTRSRLRNPVRTAVR